MEYIYFDQNIWSNITYHRKQNAFEYDKLVNNINKIKNTGVVYSDINIKESLKRDYKEEIVQEISIISEISSNRYMQNDGKIIITHPQNLIQTVLLNNYLFTELSSSIEKHMPDKSIAKDTSIKKEQNNIPIDKAANKIFDRFLGQVSQLYTDTDFSQIDGIIQTLDEKMTALFHERAKTIDEHVIAERYSKIISSILTLSLEVGKAKSNEAMKTNNSNDFLMTILSINNDPGWRTSLIQGMLGSFQYWPDDKKVLGQKGVILDVDDSEHSKYAPFCKYFISNDKHLLNRTKAASLYLGSNTSFLNYNQFLEYLNNKTEET